MNKLNKIRLAVSVLGFALGIGAPVASAVGNGAFDAPLPDVAKPAPAPLTSASAAPSPSAEEQTIVLDPVVIRGTAPRHAAQAKTPCVEANEGTRDLVQGHGTVRTFTFCH